MTRMKEKLGQSAQARQPWQVFVHENRSQSTTYRFKSMTESKLLIERVFLLGVPSSAGFVPRALERVMAVVRADASETMTAQTSQRKR